MTGKIIKGIAGFYYVHDGVSKVYECKAKGVFRNRKIKPLVGDNVEFDVLSEEECLGNIVEILQRENSLIRPAVANIDQAMIVFAVADPEPNLNLLDRFLVTMEAQDVPVVICFNKTDLGKEGEADRLAEIYRNAGYEVHLSCALEGDGIEAIHDLLRGKTTALAGPSGVGKSSLTNRIQPEAEMETGAVSEKIRRGRHTTRHSELFFVEKETFVMDTPGFSSIFVDDMKPEELKDYFPVKLMKNLVWEYDALPHALIAGGTGGGKTYFLLTLIEALLHTNAVLYILDPKNSDLADLGTVMPNVYHTKEEMIDCVNAFYEGMVQRSEEMKRHPNYKTGENYAYLGLPPCFLIFDEYVAFFEMLGTKESVSLLSQLKKIVMLGRQAGYFLIVACQRPDAKYFSDGIRDNFNFRVGLGRISELGYGMLFGSDVKKQFFQKRIKGRGYCDVGTSVISEFYTPLVPKGHDFLQTIGRLAQERQAMPEQQGKEDVIE